MEKLVLKIKDKRKLRFLKNMLEQFDFVEIEEDERKITHSFFGSAGLWENRDIDSKQLRESAWTRK
jgi:hypothetical protein